MASDKKNGRGDRSNRGSSDPRRRRTGIPGMEPLEDRRLLAGGTGWHATNNNIYDPQNGPIANIGAALIDVYRSYSDYVNGGSQGVFTPALSQTIRFTGTSVGVEVRGTGDFATLQTSLISLGMKITASSQKNLLVEGYIPIAKLPNLAVSAQVVSASPMFIPYASGFQGVGNNESVNTLNVPANFQASPSAGAGQKIAALSDSLSLFAGGLADSVRTGDLPANVQNLQDYIAPPPPPPGTPQPKGPTDEGRAMLEQIHDIAPAAQLGFASAFNGEQSFADNIRALNNAGYKTIVDDITYADEPIFQDGVIAQAVNDVTATGSTYLSSAANNSNDGYQSQFRGVNATVAGIGAGRYMNFDPTGRTTTIQLGVNVGQGNASSLFFQYDQPYGAATSNITTYLLDANGAIAYTGSSNTFATGTPIHRRSGQLHRRHQSE